MNQNGIYLLENIGELFIGSCHDTRDIRRGVFITLYKFEDLPRYGGESSIELERAEVVYNAHYFVQSYSARALRRISSPCSK